MTGHYPQGRLQVIGWAAGELEGHGHVPGSGRDDQLVKMTATNDQVPQPMSILGGSGRGGGG